MSSLDRIAGLRLSTIAVPLPAAISDAKVMTGRQKPMTEVRLLTVELRTEQGVDGLGISYSKRAGGDGQYAHALEIGETAVGEDPSDIGKVYEKLLWAGASVGRSGLATQAIAAFDVALWDVKAKRAGLSLAKLLGSYRDSVRCYNTSGGFFNSPMDELLDNATAALGRGIGGIKIKVGHPDSAVDLSRVAAVRERIGAGPALMVDANQQWDRQTALRMGRALEQYDLTWIEEPVDSADVAGHAALVSALGTPIATGEMLTSELEHTRFIEAGAADILQPDAPRVGGITPFLRVASLADHRGLQLAPHFAMELHVHLAAAYPREPWLEHFEWLEPVFVERLEIADGRIIVPTRPGIGITLTERARKWTLASHPLGKEW